MSAMIADRLGRPPRPTVRPERARRSATAVRPVAGVAGSGGPVSGVRPGAAGRGRSRLTRRGRAVVAGLMASGAILAAAPLWLPSAVSAQVAGSGAPPGAVYADLTRVVVHPGQTLWSIASRAEPTADPRIVIQQIIELNALRSTDLQPGEQLWVPRG